MQFRNKNYVLLRFSQLPAAHQKQELQRKGVKLFDYIPGNGFFAELPAELELSALQPFAVNGVFFPDESVKLSPSLERRSLRPDEASGSSLCCGSQQGRYLAQFAGCRRQVQGLSCSARQYHFCSGRYCGPPQDCPSFHSLLTFTHKR